MPQLSLCMIVKNEEAILAECLESVKDVVDEMIVLDTGSTDRTVAIAEEYGAKIPHFSWCDDFSAARNEALRHVTGDWVLVLDADEQLNPAIANRLKTEITKDNNLVINLIRQEIGAKQSPYSLTSRLFRHHPKIQFSRPYHALIDDSVIDLIRQEPDWQITQLPSIAIFHYGYTPQAIQTLDKTNRAKAAMEKFLVQHPNDPYTCSKLGALYLQLEQPKKGLKLLRRGLKSNLANANVLYELHYHLANAYIKQKEIDKSIKHFEKAISQTILPQLKLGAFNNYGAFLHSLGDSRKAIKLFEMALEIDGKFTQGYYNLGMIYKNLNQIEQAINAYKKAIECDPYYAPSYQNLGVLFLKIGNMTAAKMAFAQAIDLYDQQNPDEAQRLRDGLKDFGMEFG